MSSRNPQKAAPLGLKKAVVVVPTYNEADNVGRLIPLILARDERLSVLVVDDNSPDGTAGIVKALPGFGDRILILERESKQGLGAAYIAAKHGVIGLTRALAAVPTRTPPRNATPNPTGGFWVWRFRPR